MIQLKNINLDTTFKYFKQTNAFIDSQTNLHLSGYYLNYYFSIQEPINLNNLPYSQTIVNSNTINISYIIYDAIANNLSFTNTLPIFTTPNLIAFELLSYQNIVLSDTNLVLSASVIQDISSTISSISSILNIISATCISITSLYSSITYYSYSLPSLIQSITSSLTSITLTSSISYLQPIILSYTGDITSWSTTYSLSLNQSLIISFTNSQTIFIPLQLTGNDIYKLYLTQNITAYNSGGASHLAGLYPNNTSVNIQYTEFYVDYNGGSVGTGGTPASLNTFYIAWGLDSTDVTIINNSPFTKTVIYRNDQLGINLAPSAHIPAQIWTDYTTSWTMLGTIVLSQVSSGFIIITREV